MPLLIKKIIKDLIKLNHTWIVLYYLYPPSTILLFSVKFDSFFIAIKINYNSSIDYNERENKINNMRGLINCCYLEQKLWDFLVTMRFILTLVDDLMLKIDESEDSRASSSVRLLVRGTP